MNVHTIKVSYRRSKQPVQYESAEPTIEFVASVEDGANHLVAAASLMLDACSVAYAALAMDVPTGVGEKLGQLETSDVTEEVVVDNAAPADTKLVVPSISTVARVPGKRGRPSNAVKAAAAKESPVAPTAAASQTQTPAVAGTTAPVVDNIRANPENRVDPAVSDIPDDTKVGTVVTPAAKAAAADVPDSAAVTAASPPTNPVASKTSHQDIQAFITKNVQGKKITVVAVKALLAKFGAARVSEIPEARVDEYMKVLEDEIQLAAMA